MVIEGVFLDYIWRGLALSALSTTIVFFGALIAPVVLRRKLTSQHLRRFLNFQIFLALVVFAASFFYVAFFDADMVTRCFDKVVAHAPSFSVTRVLAAVWFTALLFLLGRDSYSLWILHKRLAASKRPISDGKLPSILHQLQDMLQLNARVQLFSTPGSGSPFVYGFQNSVVVIPDSVLALGADSLKNILAHELIHVHSSDYFWIFCERLVRRLNFFNPLAYLVAKTHHLTIEKAADEGALVRLSIEPKDLADSLMQVLTLEVGPAPHGSLLTASRGFVELQERFHSLSTVGSKDTPRGVWIALCVVSFVLVSVVSVSQGMSPITMIEAKNEVGMCIQFQHEQVLVDWLNIDPEPKSCK